MKIPTMRGTIDRRILANFHVDADVLAKVLPSPFRPKLVKERLSVFRQKRDRWCFWRTGSRSSELLSLLLKA